VPDNIGQQRAHADHCDSKFRHLRTPRKIPLIIRDLPDAAY
jgi:hypothetical protein